MAATGEDVDADSAIFNELDPLAPEHMLLLETSYIRVYGFV